MLFAFHLFNVLNLCYAQLFLTFHSSTFNSQCVSFSRHNSSLFYTLVFFHFNFVASFSDSLCGSHIVAVCAQLWWSDYIHSQLHVIYWGVIFIIFLFNDWRSKVSILETIAAYSDQWRIWSEGNNPARKFCQNYLSQNWEKLHKKLKQTRRLTR